jgi:ABC-type Fe3+-hydroxamate transport system substrate-binding protein
MLTITPPLQQPPQRMISLVPSLTEVLFAFGLGPRIVGITDYCTEPQPEVRSKPTIGGTKNPNMQAILQLAPDFVVANVEENRQQDVAYLQSQGIPVFICFPQTVAEALATIRALARATDVEVRAIPVLEKIEAAYEETKTFTAAYRKVRVFCPIWKDPWMTINRETFVHDMLETCGGTNIFADRERRFPLAADLGERPERDAAQVEGRDRRYPRVTLEEMAGLMPEVILLPDEPYCFTAADQADFVGWFRVPAVRNRRILLIDGKTVCWYWSRLDESLRSLRALLLPALA